LRRVGWPGQAGRVRLVGAEGVERGGHDASGQCGSVRRLSDVRESGSIVGDAQEVALTRSDHHRPGGR